jgi:sugar phosphate isomerase/epimerase
MTLTRRRMLAACAAALPALASVSRAAGPAEKKGRLGVVIHSYAIRQAADRASNTPGLSDPLAFVEHCHAVGAEGVQTGLGKRDAAYVGQLRDRLREWGMYVEGSVRLPEDRDDVERFTAEVRTAKESGATVLRTVLLNGRRYEVFASAGDFRKWVERSLRSLTLAEPVAARHGVVLAVENHKDYRAGELAGVLRRLDSGHVGACVDTGNNLALLEDPLEVVEALAPWARSTHLKDMAVAEHREGFLLAEVPLGEGLLDLKKVVAVLRRTRPEVRFNLEMITRDPLLVPCLGTKYWATSEGVSGRQLARILAMVRDRGSRPLPRISELPREQQLAVEEQNVRKSLAHAREHLEL